MRFQGQRLEEDAVPSSPFSRYFLAFETCAHASLCATVVQALSFGVLELVCLVFHQPVTKSKS